MKYINIAKYICCIYNNNDMSLQENKNHFHPTQILCVQATCNLKKHLIPAIVKINTLHLTL